MVNTNSANFIMFIENSFVMKIPRENQVFSLSGKCRGKHINTVYNLLYFYFLFKIVVLTSTTSFFACEKTNRCDFI